MEYLSDNTTLCLEYTEIVPDIMPKGTYDSLKSRAKKTKGMQVHGRGGNGSIVLIEYESMPEKYRARVIEKYGDPYLYASKQPILNALRKNDEAHKYYSEYVLPNGNKLPATDSDASGKTQINYVARYTSCAEWLDMIIRLTTDKRSLKKELNITIMAFWELVTEMMTIKKVSLPKNPKPLKAKIKKYQNEGYGSLVEVHKFGNSYSTKVDHDKLKDFLRLTNQNDDTIIAVSYNKWAEENNKPLITHGAVGYWRKEWKNGLILSVQGKAKAQDRLLKVISTKRASAPLVKIGSDDNVMDVYFYKPETIIKRSGKTKVIPENKWFRLYLYVVKDTYNDLPLGYAAGHSVTKELIYDAYRDANRYIRRLTKGGDYFPHQIQADRWGIGVSGAKTELHQYFERMATFTPPKAGHSRSKSIEASFGTVHHQVLKQLFPYSYSGHNITSKEKINPDSLDPKKFPHVNQAPAMLAQFINILRNTPRGGCEVSREQEWMEAFEQSEKSKARLMTPEIRMQWLGRKHTETNTITKYGIMPTLKDHMGNSIKCQFEVSQKMIFENAGTPVQIYYDPADHSEIMYTDGKGLRGMAINFEKPHNAIADQSEWDHKRIKYLQDEQSQLDDFISDFIGENAERRLIDAESRVQANVLVKAVSHADNALMTARMNGAIDAGSTVGIAEKTLEDGGVRAENDTKEIIKKPLKPFKQDVLKESVEFDRY